MATEVPLKLVQPEVEPEVYQLERRRATRHSVSGRVTAVRHENQFDGPHNRICSFQLLNMSDGGVGVLSQDSVELNSSIAIYLPPHGPERGFDLVGTVVRCVNREWGHEIGIKLLQKAAA